MSAFAGIVTRTGRPIPASVRNTLRGSLSRCGAPTLEVEESGAFFVGLATDALQIGIGVHKDAAGVTLLAGDPLLPRRATSAGTPVQTVGRVLGHGDFGTLAEARGTFCAAHWARAEDGVPAVLRLAVDAMGVRPLYMTETPDFVAFATSLRALAGLSITSDAVDPRGLAEQAGLGMSLGARTVFRDISILRSGELVQVCGDRTLRRAYRSWTDVPLDSRTVDEAARDAYTEFQQAVRLRLRGDEASIAFLSGGLDSRVIVSALRAAGSAQYTFNFSPAGSLDGLLGERFAAAAGTRHTSRRNDMTFPDWTALIRRGIVEEGAIHDDPDVLRPDVCWSGDGGSVCAGYVYMTPPIIAALGRGDFAAAADAFLAHVGGAVPVRILSGPGRAEAKDALRTGVLEELERIPCADPLRRFHLFLLHNDQRRHLARHFETIGEHGMEFLLPFFDATFLERVLAAPARESVYHRFYTRWLSHFPAVTTSVPWQTYPGHEPCPLPMPERAATQWGAANAFATTAGVRSKAMLTATRDLLARREFPRALDRRALRMAYMLHRYRIRDQGYAMAAAHGLASWLVPAR